MPHHIAPTATPVWLPMPDEILADLDKNIIPDLAGLYRSLWTEKRYAGVILAAIGYLEEYRKIIALAHGGENPIPGQRQE